MTATALIASDLDRTLIYSRKFFPTPPARAQCVELLNGEQISFMTAPAIGALNRLATNQIVVPATTRTVAQYQRITLPGGPYPFAVTSNGGTILVNGHPDPQWAHEVQSHIRTDSIPLDEVLAALRWRIRRCDWVRTLKVAEGLFCCLVVNRHVLPADFIESWRHWCAPYGWKVSQQGRKIYTVPRALCKSHAVHEVQRRLTSTGSLAADAAMLAAGDGALDAPLLERADAGIRPAHGELHAMGWSTARLTVTTADGAEAAEEILAWFQLRTTAPHHKPADRLSHRRSTSRHEERNLA